MILPIVTLGHPALRKKCKSIHSFDKALEKLSMNMVEVMNASNGIGLAAPQIGVGKRLFVMNTTNDRSHFDIFINPIIKQKSKTIVDSSEGCLSIPKLEHQIKRHKEIVLQYSDFNQNIVEKEYFGLESICIQHEIDHLDGILFIDHVDQSQKELLYQTMLQLGFETDTMQKEVYFKKQS